MLNRIHGNKTQYIYAPANKFKSGDIVRATTNGVTIQARVTVSHDLLVGDVIDVLTGVMHKAVTYVAVDNVTFKKVSAA